MNESRRDFLRKMGLGLGSGAMLSAIENFSLTSALAQGTGYRALVCIFLAGGNDGHNMLIPNANSPSVNNWQDYFNARNPAGLAIARTSLLAITPASLGTPFGLHPAMVPLRNLWNQGKVAFVSNVGPLVRPLVNPTPRQAYQSNPQWRPFQLFSHSDQVQIWQTANASTGAQTGWGGRTADQFAPHSSGFPMITSIAGNQRFTIGQVRRPLILPRANRPPAAPNLRTVLTLSGFGDPHGSSRRAAMDYLRTIDNGPRLRAAANNVMEQALQVGAALATADVNLATTFPATVLGDQLLQIARVIKANLTQPALGLTHQIFFAQIGGFDTHSNQVNNQNNLLTQVNAALNAFYNATVELGIPDRVTTFTLSDFGRTLNPAGSGGTVGSDHAWGNHMIVMGDSVIGGDLYGVAGPNGTPYPILRMGNSGPQDTDTRGRFVPSTSVEQYANTLAKWFGLPQTNAVLDAVFPSLRNNFSPTDLGFLNPLT